MTVTFTLPARLGVDLFKDSASVDDVVRYEFDCTPWEDDNSTITSADWSVENNSQATISGEQLTSGVATALITFSQAGTYLIKILLTTSTQIKVLWLEVKVKDLSRGFSGDDYGAC